MGGVVVLFSFGSVDWDVEAENLNVKNVSEFLLGRLSVYLNIPFKAFFLKTALCKTQSLCVKHKAVTHTRVQSSQLIVHFLLPHVSLLENLQPIPFDWALSQSSQRWPSVAFPSSVSDQQKCACSSASRQTGVSSQLSPCPWKSGADCVNVCERVYIHIYCLYIYIHINVYIYIYTIILNMCLDFIFKCFFFLKCETLIIPIFFDMERSFNIGKIGGGKQKENGLACTPSCQYKAPVPWWIWQSSKNGCRATMIEDLRCWNVTEKKWRVKTIA